MNIEYQYKSFSSESTKEIDEWLNRMQEHYGGQIEVIGYSAYGVGDVRNHTEFLSGVYITIKVRTR